MKNEPQLMTQAGRELVEDMGDALRHLKFGGDLDGLYLVDRIAQVEQQAIAWARKNPSAPSFQVGWRASQAEARAFADDLAAFTGPPRWLAEAEPVDGWRVYRIRRWHPAWWWSRALFWWRFR